MLLAPDVIAQTNAQLWGEIRLEWIKSRDLTMRLDLEPKVLVSKPSDDPAWAALDVTPAVEFTRGNWIDVLGETLVARTRQSDDVKTTELTPRIGLRLHILSNLKNDLFKERRPKRRLVLRDLLRFEWRNLQYSNGQPDSSAARVRNRVELRYPLNRAGITVDGAVSAVADAEWFWTGEDVDERYANQQRVRAGVEIRRSYEWRYETLIIWDRSRHATTEYTTSDYAIDFRLHRVW